MYQGFDEPGRYRIVINARDYDSLDGQPVELDVYTWGDVYLPLILK